MVYAQTWRAKNKQCISPASDCWKNKEHPDVDKDDQEDLVDELASNIFTQEEGPVNDDEEEL